MGTRFAIILAGAAIVVTAITCDSSSVPDVVECTLLPGECLLDNGLLFSRSHNMTANDPFKIVCSLDIGHTVLISDQYARHSVSKVPDSEIWSRFPDAETVHDRYDKLCTELFRSSSDQIQNEISVFAAGTCSITADKPFAGRLSGSDLSDLLWEREKEMSPLSRDLLLHLCLDPSGFGGSIPPAFVMSLPKTAVDAMADGEIITFSCSIPVRVMLLLQGLEGRIVDPEAAIPFREEVLQGVFSFQKGTGFRSCGKPLS